MAIDLLTVSIRHERRVRLVFSANLAAAAFTSLSYYSVTSIDSKGPSPSVVAVFAVASAPNVAELQLSCDLAPGGKYQFEADGVPALDASVTPTPSTAVGCFGDGTHAVEQVDGFSESDAILYGIDIVWRGVDFLEEADGDLAQVSGPPNVREALWRRGMSNGLKWDPRWGVRAREFVDGTPGALINLRGRFLEQFLDDDRVTECTVDLDTSTPGESTWVLGPKLLGDASVEPIRVVATPS